MIKVGLNNSDLLTKIQDDKITVKRVSDVFSTWIKSVSTEQILAEIINLFDRIVFTISSNVSENICPFIDLIILIANSNNFPHDTFVKCLVLLFFMNSLAAPKSLKSKYLEAIDEYLKKIPQDSRSLVLKSSLIHENDSKKFISMILDAHVNEEASCHIISAMTKDDRDLVTFVVKNAEKMLEKDRFEFGSQLIREILNVEDGIIEHRSTYVVWYLENVLHYFVEQQISFYAQTLSIFSLLVEICTENPVCHTKLIEYEPNQGMAESIRMYISYLESFRVDYYVMTAFKDLYSRFIRLLSVDE